MADKNHVLCLMNNHGLPCGLLNVESVIYITDEQMPDGDFKKSDKRLFEFPYEGRMYHLEMTNGKSDDLETPEILLDIIGTVIKGKPFSYEDLTDEQKELLARPALEAVETKQDVITDLDYIRNGAALGNSSVQPSDIVGFETKQHAESTYQPIIDDLSSIRSGAELGSTSVQPSEIADMETKTHAEENYQMKGNYAIAGSSYTKGEADELFLTEHQDISGKQNVLVSGENIKTINGQSILGNGNIFIESGGGYEPPVNGIPKSDLAEDVRQSLSKADTALQAHQDISGKQDVINDLSTIRSGASLGATSVQPSAITDMETKTHASATYQPKGDYASVGDFKTINGESILGEGNITITSEGGGYAPPSGGIPKSDLAEDVQTSLGKADTAVQPSDIDDSVESEATADVAEEVDGSILDNILLKTPQALTDEQKAIVRSNIGAVSAEILGDINAILELL